MALTKQDLNAAGCFTRNCTHDHSVIYFHGRCHPHAPVQACYVKATGEIIMRCARCEKVIMHVAVAEP